MGTGRSSNGGGKRDNAPPGVQTVGGARYYSAEASMEDVDESMTDKKWEKGLTQDEIEAIEAYTSEGEVFYTLNEELRKTGQLDAYSNVIRKGLESALDKYELKEETLFHRKTTAEIFKGADTVEKLRARFGETFVDDGFMSAATRDALDEQFTARPVTLHIKTPPGKGIGAYVKNHSTHPEETEFLFNRGAMVKLTGAYEDASGHLHVNVEYVGRKDRYNGRL